MHDHGGQRSAWHERILNVVAASLAASAALSAALQLLTDALVLP
jgi:hypothetical protein